MGKFSQSAMKSIITGTVAKGVLGKCKDDMLINGRRKKQSKDRKRALDSISKNEFTYSDIDGNVVASVTEEILSVVTQYGFGGIQDTAGTMVRQALTRRSKVACCPIDDTTYEFCCKYGPTVDIQPVPTLNESQLCSIVSIVQQKQNKKFDLYRLQRVPVLFWNCVRLFGLPACSMWLRRLNANPDTING
jgi:hypothetical protein